LSLHLSRLTSLRVCVGTAPLLLLLGGAFEFFGLPPSSFVANNEALQQASAHLCSSGLDRGQPLPPSLPSLNFLVLVNAGSIHFGASKIKPINAHNSHHSGAASASSSKVHRRNSCLAAVQIKPVSHSRHAEVLCLLHLSDDFASSSLSPHLVLVCAGAAPLPFVLEGCLGSLGYYFQLFSPTTRLYSRHQLTYDLQGGIAAIPSLHLFPPCSYPLPPSLPPPQIL